MNPEVFLRHSGVTVRCYYKSDGMIDPFKYETDNNPEIDIRDLLGYSTLIFGNPDQLLAAIRTIIIRAIDEGKIT